jgi:hypothetical protein
MATKVTWFHFLGLFGMGLHEGCCVSPVPKIRITRAIQQVDEGKLNRIRIKLG